MKIEQMLTTDDGYEAVMVLKLCIDGRKLTIPLSNYGDHLEVCEFDGMDEVLDEFETLIDAVLAIANSSEKLRLTVSDWSDPFINLWDTSLSKYDLDDAYLSIVDYEEPDYYYGA